MRFRTPIYYAHIWCETLTPLLPLWKLPHFDKTLMLTGLSLSLRRKDNSKTLAEPFSSWTTLTNTDL